MKCTEHLQLRPHIRLWFGSFPHISEHWNIGTSERGVVPWTEGPLVSSGGKAGLFPQHMNLQTPTYVIPPPAWYQRRAVPCLSGYKTRSSAKQRDISDVLTLLSAARGTVTPLHKNDHFLPVSTAAVYHTNNSRHGQQKIYQHASHLK